MLCILLFVFLIAYKNTFFFYFSAQNKFTLRSSLNVVYWLGGLAVGWGNVKATLRVSSL